MKLTPRLAGPQVVESTGIVVTPYMEYPQLMGLLLRLLSEGDLRARREVVKMLGIVGALDPHTHKCNQATMQGEGRLESEGVRAQRGTREGHNADGNGSLAGGLTRDDYTGDLLQVSARWLPMSAGGPERTVAIRIWTPSAPPAAWRGHLTPGRCPCCGACRPRGWSPAATSTTPLWPSTR